MYMYKQYMYVHIRNVDRYALLGSSASGKLTMLVKHATHVHTQTLHHHITDFLLCQACAILQAVQRLGGVHQHIYTPQN